MLITIGSGQEKVETSAVHYISIPVQLYNDLCAYVDHYDTEVSGCGMVERIEHRTKAEDKDEPDVVEIEFRISEVYLPSKQSNSAASTDIDDDTIADLVHSLLAQGKNTEHLRLHWHSHADMDTFHSGTDEDNYKTLSNGEFLVSLVLNKAHKFLGRIDYFNPVRVTLSGVAVYMQLESENKPSKEALENIKKLDKYVDEHKSLIVTTWGRGEQQEYGYVGYLDDKKLTIDDIEIARQCGISMVDATRFKACRTYQCDTCKDQDKCNLFLYQTSGYDY